MLHLSFYLTIDYCCCSSSSSSSCSEGEGMPFIRLKEENSG